MQTPHPATPPTGNRSRSTAARSASSWKPTRRGPRSRSRSTTNMASR